MKNSTLTLAQILGIALLATFVAAPGWAAPDPNPPASARSDLRVDNNDSYRTYRGTVEILLPGNEFNARIDGRIYKIYATDSTRDLRVGDRINIYGQMDRGVNIRYAKITRTDSRDNDNRPDDRRDRDDNWRDRDNNGRDRNRRDRYDNRDDRDVYIGEITYVRNDREFDVRSEGRTYNIYSSKAVRDVNRGDRVRVTGDRANDNDIRDARVSVLRGGDDNDDNISYAGVVTAIRNNREFDVRVDGLIYNVHSQERVRDLNVGDQVRVNGRRFGGNDIRDASALVVRYR